MIKVFNLPMTAPAKIYEVLFGFTPGAKFLETIKTLTF